MEWIILLPVIILLDKLGVSYTGIMLIYCAGVYVFFWLIYRCDRKLEEKHCRRGEQIMCAVLWVLSSAAVYAIMEIYIKFESAMEEFVCAAIIPLFGACVWFLVCMFREWK